MLEAKDLMEIREIVRDEIRSAFSDTMKELVDDRSLGKALDAMEDSIVKRLED